MKTNIFKTSAIALTAAAALAGCVKEPTCNAPVDYSKLKFVVNVIGPNETNTDTRALKPGWVSGDKVVAFFDAAADKYATFTFDGTAWIASGASTAGIAASGAVQAIHAGNTAFSFDGTTLSGIGGDLLYETDGTFTVDAPSSTAYVTLTMDRGFTTAIKMDGSTTKAKNDNWRLGGQGLWVMGSTNTLAATAAVAPATGLQSLFVQSNASSGIVATPDAAFTDATVAVFHVWDQDLDNDATSFNVYDVTAPGTIYTRGYLADLTVGASMVIHGPESAQSASWSSVSLSLVTAAAPTGVVSPAAGATPATTITPGNAQYTAALAWDASPALTGDGKFANGTAYSATVTLTAASSYTFTGGFANGDDLSAFAVNGVTPTWVSNSGTDLVLSYAFPATAAAVTAGAVGGVTAPVVGATPATAVTPTSEYTGTIAWNPADAAFEQGKAYTATVTMTAANGFTFANMDAAALAAAYPVAGANAPAYSVSADGKTLTITAPFTATPANGVTYGPNGADEDWN